MKKSIDEHTKLVGLFGNPVEHSLSPLFMNYALEKLGVDCRYIAFTINKTDLQNALRSMRTLGFRGINITIPFKSAVIDFLDSLDQSAQRIGAVNCIVNQNGVLTGCNTDYLGFLKPLKDRGAVNGMKALVIGSGGAARAVIYALIHEGIKTISLLNRTPKNARAVLNWCKDELAFPSIHFAGDSQGISPDFTSAFHIIVNTTPLGMYPETARCPLPENIQFHRDQTIYDLIYNPWETELLRKARASGAAVINGFEMLIIQGLYSLSHWFPVKREQIFSLQDDIIRYTRGSMPVNEPKR